MKFFRSAVVVVSIVGLLSISPVYLTAQDNPKRPATNKPAQPPQGKGKKPQQDDQTQDPGDGVIKLDTELVDIVFTVLDDRSRLAGSIKQDQIDVTEDGVPQQVKFFDKNTNVPIIAALLIDLSSSQEFVLPQEKDAA